MMTTASMASHGPREFLSVFIIACLTCFLESASAAQQQAPVAEGQSPMRIPIPDMPLSHYQFWLKNNPSALKNFEEICSQSAIHDIISEKQLAIIYSNLTFDNQKFTTDLNFGKQALHSICSRISLVKKSCWGYENNCEDIYLMPECTSSESQDEQEKREAWFNQADFGYILNRRRELSRYCAPDRHSNHSVRSSLECTKHFRTCRGVNLYINFESSQPTPHFGGPVMFKRGQIGGWNCDLQTKRIPEEGSQPGFLISWFNELKDYTKILNIEPPKACEEHIEKRVYFVQPDSSANMYHYFCNFLNLFATMHLNNRFSADNILVLWDNKLPKSPFESMWSVFSKNPPKSLEEFRGKKVCFDKFIFAMPPRMIEGLYYNTHPVDGCSKSGLFDAFSKHVLYKLGIEQHAVKPGSNQQPVLRVTIVSRSTPTRKILNEKDLKAAADDISPEFLTQIVDFANLTFLDQLKISHNTDILVGVHGAGLTHTLFLPNWAALLELYDCKDKCYHDLARLRGVGYFRLEDGANFGEKNENFHVNVHDFTQILKQAAHKVRELKAKMMANPLANPTPDLEKNEVVGSEASKSKFIVTRPQASSKGEEEVKDRESRVSILPQSHRQREKQLPPNANDDETIENGQSKAELSPAQSQPQQPIMPENKVADSEELRTAPSPHSPHRSLHQQLQPPPSPRDNKLVEKDASETGVDPSKLQHLQEQEQPSSQKQQKQKQQQPVQREDYMVPNKEGTNRPSPLQQQNPTISKEDATTDGKTPNTGPMSPKIDSKEEAVVKVKEPEAMPRLPQFKPSNGGVFEKFGARRGKKRSKQANASPNSREYRVVPENGLSPSQTHEEL